METLALKGTIIYPLCERAVTYGVRLLIGCEYIRRDRKCITDIVLIEGALGDQAGLNRINGGLLCHLLRITEFGVRMDLDGHGTTGYLLQLGLEGLSCIGNRLTRCTEVTEDDGGRIRCRSCLLRLRLRGCCRRLCGCLRLCGCSGGGSRWCIIGTARCHRTQHRSTQHNR